MSRERAAAVLHSGIAAAKAGSKPRARAAFREAVALDPTCELSWLWLAGVTEDPSEGIVYLERVLRLNPANDRARAGIDHFRAKLPPAQWYCPICQGRAKDKFLNCPGCGAVLDLARADQALANPTADAARVQDGAARLAADVRAHPTFVAHYYLGMALLNLGRPEDALPQFRAAQKYKPDDPNLVAQVVQLEAAVSDAAPPTRKFQAPPRARPTPPPAGPGPKTVLIVDDSPTLRRILGLTLQKNGFQVIEAADGEDALDRARERPPDLVLLDVHMPGLDGFAVCKRLREDPATARTPVILLGGKDGFLDRMRGRTAGSDRHVAKPFQPDALLRVVREYCPAAG
jgi:twitching motility two-component system response regulator PilG